MKKNQESTQKSTKREKARQFRATRVIVILVALTGAILSETNIFDHNQLLKKANKRRRNHTNSKCFV